MSDTALPSVDAVTAALATVKDPEIHRPITDLGMVDDIAIALDGMVEVKILLTTAGCPLRDRITNDVTNAVMTVPGVTNVRVVLDVMSRSEERRLAQECRSPRSPHP